MGATLLEDSLELFLEAFPLAESGDAVILSLVTAPVEVDVLDWTAVPEELLPLEGIELTLPDERPEVFPELRFPDVPVDTAVLSLVVTELLVEILLPVFAETVPDDPLELLKSAAWDWAGLSLLRLVPTALLEAVALVFAVADRFSILADGLCEAILAARDVRPFPAIFSVSPSLKLILTLDGTLLTMVVSTRRREKSVALTIVMPLLLLLFITTVVLLITVFGRLPYPQTLGDHPI